MNFRALPGTETPTTTSTNVEMNLQSNPITVPLEPRIPSEGEGRAFREDAFQELCTMLPGEINPEVVKLLWEPMKTNVKLYPVRTYMTIYFPLTTSSSS